MATLSIVSAALVARYGQASWGRVGKTKVSSGNSPAALDKPEVTEELGGLCAEHPVMLISI
ncbi:hypothetical protein DV517_74220 [Streptomyces sp. S816]|uniref:hypothetical protein n=1 Tax=Streptomyces sp. S816 TaxID=2283197 RepID=UPI00109C5981|nr:hypothetical protein [Streptomyces sp. S816]TGZ12327.1 hypothetical protein DV517_74220 [Streptomyces sp. S816]